MSRLSFNGLSSGIDTDAIIKQVVRFNQTRIDTLKSRQSQASTRQTSLKTVGTRLTTLQTSINKLARSVSTVFDGRKATSSDETLVKVAASKNAEPVTQTLRINQTAKANIVSSQGFAAANSAINTGTFEISAGGTVGTITIDNTNNTLQGLASAINGAAVGVRASIVNSGGTNGHKLLLTSAKTGEANSISITNNLTGGGSTQPTFATTVQAAQDAQVQIGSGGGAIVVSSATNTVADLIPGVTLSLQNADVNKDVTITVTNDTEGVATAIKGFVADFNSVVDFITDQTKSDPTTGRSGPLAGNRQVKDILDQIRASIIQPNPLLPSSINRLSVFGVSIDRTGHLVVNDATLNSVLNGEVSGVTLEEVKRGFSLYGKSNTNNLVLAAASSKTKESTTGAYQVDISQAAEAATITGSSEVAETTVIDSSNNQLTLSLDGQTSGTITLAAGTYTRSELAAELQTRLRADTTIGRQLPNVTLSGNSLVLSSSIVGSNSNISALAGTAITSGVLGLDASQSDSGLDVIGKFIVNGTDETAVGSGNVLVGDTNNANTADLRIVASFTSAQVLAGAEGEITVTRGIASRFSLALEGLLDASTGRLKSIADQLQTDSSNLDSQVQKEIKFLSSKEEALRRQFSAVESAIGKSKANGSAITTSLSSLIK